MNNNKTTYKFHSNLKLVGLILISVILSFIVIYGIFILNKDKCIQSPVEYSLDVDDAESTAQNDKNTKDTPEYNSKTSIIVTNQSTPLNEISNMLFDKYLSKFKESTIENEKISDYKIEYIEIKKNIGSKYEFYVKYSVLPQSSKYILVGNGVKSGNGWITELSRFVAVSKNSEEYSIEELGTGSTNIMRN